MTTDAGPRICAMSPRVGMFSIFSLTKLPPVLLHIATARV
jgi:hypothetical protein